MSVKEAGSGEEAITTMEEYTPDVLLVDLLMPGKTGFEVIEEVRAKGDPVFTYGIGGEAGLGYEVFVNNTAAVSFGVNYDLRYAGEQAVRHGAFGVFKVRFY